MHNYLIDTEFATKSLIETIYHEEITYKGLSVQYDQLKGLFDHLYWDFSTADGSEDFSDLQVISKFNRMAQFGQEANFQGRKLELEELLNSINNKKFSIDSLAMSLLQIAKQGMSIAHGPLQNCPTGRQIGTETLKNVIWQSRNQAIHYEENNPKPAVRQCFSNLKNYFGVEFDININPPENKAKKVIDLLGWNKYENYIADMESILY